ncbi:beta-1,3-galactosyl-O-glycosyl-glycoprotein beta-1,6-N-acetylglucosaminyltransferase-like [Babylonia areolata]|uniref:beta-1,3-galactosyl-O-glycosyl-glycoprotein beta-1,6-N-acetylglucosaminyltransferase-like n=1 Tax=Babylonia areolata TaxID=304850 RepID=UPI003FD497E4
MLSRMNNLSQQNQGLTDTEGGTVSPPPPPPPPAPAAAAAAAAVGADNNNISSMLCARRVQKWVVHFLCYPGVRVFRRRALVGGMFLLTLLVIVARLETEDLLFADENTLVLKAGFPAIRAVTDNKNTNNNNTSFNLYQPAFNVDDLPPLATPRHVLTLPSSSSSSQVFTLPPLQMAALVAAQRSKWLGSHSYQPPLQRPLEAPSCQKLVQGDAAEQRRGKAFMVAHQRVEKPASAYILETQNCSRFIEERGYVMAATAEEVAFPIAYSIMMYTGVEQAERLLRAVYRPHNYHCIHVDLKAPEELMRAMRGIAGCLPNVFVASKLNKVYWATWSSLEALIFCMEDLWKASKSWKYYINLTGQEFPLKTNLQLVRILTALNGSNIVDASTDPSRTWRWYNNFGPPHGIVPYKGMVFVMACRGFVDYILHHHVAQDFLNWVRYTDMPDETYFPSLNHNPHLLVPGSYKGPPDTNALTKPYLARYVNWDTNWKDGDGRYNYRFPCFGTRVRDLCIFGVGDLPLMTTRKELFVNKLYSTFQPLTYNCMEEWLMDMTIAEYAGHLALNTSFYSSLDIVHNKVV